ncbi:Archaemetzincin-2 [Madurella mycetomatis]|uniref:Archaemetzincin-2 n=1 Tax=Madurella mycetomatis TaxID=100816 RepID=A0A175VYP1_9PEZI|nr:Archaemetzincin-2 [Madurella mycetomatis]KXX79655.1 Archaemetzincin-2 [Madurella mycetomatis]
MPPKVSSACAHEHAQHDVSLHAEEAGFKRPSLARRKAAMTLSGRATRSGRDEKHHQHLETLFPGPLVLPNDALAIDLTEPPQSMKSWMQGKLRNPVTQERKTIYLAPVPGVAKQLSSVRNWAVPSTVSASHRQACKPPETDHVREYLKAFYHPLPVKLLPQGLCFVPWDVAKDRLRPKYIGLQAGDGVTRVRTRPSPDGVFYRQLNLNDILDAAIETLPDDAYALVILVDHDLYEDDDDDFCCGRAYGSSRVAVVSSARYHPSLDHDAGVDRKHMWPASHCAAYVRDACRPPAARDSKRRRVVQTGVLSASPGTAMVAVIQSAPPALKPENDLEGLWLSRVVRTVSHELGHCFCLAHCSYYACVMQGTAGMAEDVRQPPYLCMVCLAKLTRAIRGVDQGMDETKFQISRYMALARFCGEHLQVAMFAAYRCWLYKRIEMLKTQDAAPGKVLENSNLARCTEET